MTSTDPDAHAAAPTDPDAGRWLDADQQRAWRAYLRGSRMLELAFDADLADHGVRLPEYEILTLLSEAPGRRLRMHTIATEAVQSRSRLTHTAKRLEAKGWVLREASAEDGRGVELTLTPAGWEVLRALAPAHVASVRDHLIDVLTPEQLDVVGEAMRAVITDLERLRPCDEAIAEADPDGR